MSGENGQDAGRDCCPNPECIWHDPEKIPKGKCWYRKHGFYFSEQHGKVQRYICNNCRKTFCPRTDSDEWYLHFDNISIPALAEAWLAGGTVQEIAREYGITQQMVRTRLKRSDANDVWELDYGTEDPGDDPPKAS